METRDNNQFETRCIHGYRNRALTETFRPITFPIFQTAAFSHSLIGHNANGYDYTRETNPTRHHVEEVVAALEGTADALAFSSGMAAISTCLELFRPGDEIICSEDLYGGVFRLHHLVSEKNGLVIRYVDTTDNDVLEAAVNEKTAAIYLETPTNPTMLVSDIAHAAAIAHAHDALLIVDNTFLTPCFQNPAALGADLVIHSASKYLGGHNDTIGGFLCVADQDRADQLRMLQKTLGNALAPFDSWLIARGIKTLAVRLERQAASAFDVATWLEAQDDVERVLYPGLASFPQRDLITRQAHGFGAMISFYVKDASVAERILTHVQVITFAESLGGTESLITYPITQTHCDTPEDLKQRLGINARLLRLSVGLEAADDLIADLRQALYGSYGEEPGAGVGVDGETVANVDAAGTASAAVSAGAVASPFDHVVDRHHTLSLKFDAAVERGYPADVLPLWVADMDFPTAPPILDALRKAVDFGIFGYSYVDESYDNVVTSWFERNFSWSPDPNWIVKTPGVVFALAHAVRSFTEPGDAVLIQTPVYYPFFSVVQNNGRVLVESELILRDGHYEIDFDAFEQAVVDNRVRMFILCSPHNPVGRVWTRDELRRLAEICAAHSVIVVADEIHCDLTLPEHPHTMFADAAAGTGVVWISCTAPSKTFNLAGLQASHIFIENEMMREQFKKEMLASGYSELNMLGLVAARAAYEQGEPWLAACKAYLRENLDFLRDYLQANLPQLTLIEPEGTYFAWIDFSALGLADEDLDDLIVHEAKLWLDAGHIFGAPGSGYQRVVLACPRATLAQALDQLKDAISGL